MPLVLVTGTHVQIRVLYVQLTQLEDREVLILSLWKTEVN